MDLVIQTDGNVRMIYDETIDPHSIGTPNISRGSHVEPIDEGLWIADLSPMNGPVLGPFDLRSKALEVELDWLRHHWLLAESS